MGTSEVALLLLNVVPALIRQAELWSRQPAQSEEELQARHARVTAFMAQIQALGDSERGDRTRQDPARN